MSSPSNSSIALQHAGAVASVTAHVWNEGAAGPVVMLAHGAGSHVDHPVHQGVCAAVADAGCTVVGFNFAYSEAGRRSPDRPDLLLGCYSDAAQWVEQQFPGRGIVGGGRSMGGRMSSLLAADGYPFVGLALMNYPLVAGRGGADRPPRTAHWPSIHVPVLFVHGTRDRLFPTDVYEAARDLLTVPVTMHVIDDADHVFSVPKRTGRTAADVYTEVGRAVAGWLDAAVMAA